MDGSEIELLRRTAALARLALEEGEEALLAGQFASILDHFRVLSELDVEGEEPMTGPAPPGDGTRPDEARPSTPRERFLAGAPDPRGDHYGVPKTIPQESGPGTETGDGGTPTGAGDRDRGPGS